VTVIVPGFDVAPYVPEALASLREQTRGDWRAILVDDASTDDTGALFDAAAAQDERFEVVHHETRRGLAAARNTGLDRVDTPFVGFLDADDRMRPDALSRMVGTLERTGSDAVAGAYVRLRPTPSGGYASGDVQPWVAAATSPERTSTSLLEHPDASGNIVAWSKVSRTDLWHRTGLRFPDGRLYEDQIVAQQMFTQASTFDVIPDVVVEWRERADGTSITQGKDTVPVLREYLAALRAGIEVLQQAGMTDAVASRVRLIRTMDLPPLVAIAQSHDEPAYAAQLQDFVDWLTRIRPAG
jgi:CDP-glycerol glycerophosphotransferase